MAASKPTFPLSVVIYTLHPFTLNWYFGTLIIFWVVPLLEYTLTAVPLFPKIYDVKTFGVGQESEGFLPQTP